MDFCLVRGNEKGKDSCVLGLRVGAGEGKIAEELSRRLPDCTIRARSLNLEL